jgi:hypothetical protein
LASGTDYTTYTSTGTVTTATLVPLIKCWWRILLICMRI